MRGSVLVSLVAHLALLAGVFAVRGPATVIVPGPDVVQVSLLDAPSPLAIAPPPPEPAKPRPRVAEIKPEEDTGVKLAPEKHPARKEPPKEERPAETPPPALPYASVGSTGLRGQVAVDAANFEFTYYLLLVRNQVARNWAPPAGVAGVGQAVVYFRVGRGGDVRGARLETGSGQEFFDRAALRAVLLSDPLPPLPLGFSGGELGVHFGFEYAAP